jgi:hypothetical protein
VSLNVETEAVHPAGCQCVPCRTQRAAAHKAIAERLRTACLKHANDELAFLAEEDHTIEEIVRETGASRDMVEQLVANFSVIRLLDVTVCIVNRQPSANAELYLETVTSLNFLHAMAAAERGGKWDAIKTLSGRKAEAFLVPAERLLMALPSLIHQLRERVRVSEDQGRKSLEMKRLKRLEREAAEAQATEQVEAQEAAVDEQEAAGAGGEIEADLSADAELPPVEADDLDEDDDDGETHDGFADGDNFEPEVPGFLRR